MDKQPENALEILSRYTDTRHLHIQAQVWRLLSRLTRSLKIPDSIKGKAQGKLDEIVESKKSSVKLAIEKEHMNMLERQLLWF